MTSQKPILESLNQWVETLIHGEEEENERKRLETYALLKKETFDKETAERLEKEKLMLAAKELMSVARLEKLKQQNAQRQTPSTAPLIDEKKIQPLLRPIRSSQCHPSRETMNYSYRSITDHVLTQQLASMAKSLPLELVFPKPFSKSKRLELNDNPSFVRYSSTLTKESSNQANPSRPSMSDNTYEFATKKKYFLMKPFEKGS
ncbi:hypothetical protein HMI55_004049 [Coelomomyces lativittatus]|nr:hypothetical protein HMI55_004049 [Coelomomyces lativittatus]KAJ1512696.1 hypothetical protein HMI56_003694 [Coelomomyces lativittatus]